MKQLEQFLGSQMYVYVYKLSDRVCCFFRMQQERQLNIVNVFKPEEE